MGRTTLTYKALFLLCRQCSKYLPGLATLMSQKRQKKWKNQTPSLLFSNPVATFDMQLYVKCLFKNYQIQAE